MNETLQKYMPWAVILLAVGVVAYLLSGYYHADRPGDTAIQNELRDSRKEIERIRTELAGVQQALAASRREIAEVRGEIGAARNIVVSVRSDLERDTRDVEEVKRILAENRSIIEAGERRAQERSKTTQN